jgi:hypothetical protein
MQPTKEEEIHFEWSTLKVFWAIGVFILAGKKTAQLTNFRIKTITYYTSKFNG